VSNIRTHGTTGESPRERFGRDERAQLKSYLSPVCITQEASEARKLDNTTAIMPTL